MVSLRVQELLVRIAGRSSSNIEEVMAKGPLQSLLDTINGDDVLLKLNVLELFGLVCYPPALALLLISFT